MGLREDWEEDSGGCRCVCPEEERSRCGVGLLCQWSAPLVWPRDGGCGLVVVVWSPARTAMMWLTVKGSTETGKICEVWLGQEMRGC